MIVFGGTDEHRHVYLDDALAMTPVAGAVPLATTSQPPQGGTILRNPPSGCYANGSTVTLTAQPAVGFGFDGWSGDASGNANPITVTLSSAKNIVAHFIGNTVTVTRDPAAGGSVALDPNQATYAPGASVMLTAIPAAGYGFTSWGGDASGADNPLTIVVDGPKEIVAHFTGYPVAVVAAPSLGGSVTRSPDQASYAPGASVTLTAQSNGGWVFSGWSGDASGNANPLTLTVNGPLTIQANFSSIPATCGGWTPYAPPASPFRRRLFATVWDPVRRRMIVIGGYGNGAFLGDVWAFTPATGNWEPLQWSGVPGSGENPAFRTGAQAAYDPALDRIVFFGGNTANGHQNGQYSLAIDAAHPERVAWNNLQTLGFLPSPRAFGTMVFDPPRSRMLLFGGETNDTHQLQVLDLAGGTPIWSPLDLPGAPPSREGQIAVYDPVRDRMLVIGGFTAGFGDRNDVWALSLSGAPSWEELDPAGTLPPPHSFCAAAYDPARDRVLMFAGNGANPFYDDTWALDLAHGPAWVNLTGYSGPPPRRRGSSGAAFDPAGNKLVVFGGVDSPPETDLSDTWALDLSQGLSLDIAADPPGEGTVTRSPEQGCFSNGTSVTLTAVPGTGFRFIGWSGDASGDANPLVLTMTGHRAIVAHFDAGPTATLVSRFEARDGEQGVELRWRIGSPERVTGVEVERADRAAGPWAALALARRDELGETVAVDGSAEPEHTYLYRLRLTLRDGSSASSEPIVAQSQRILASAIRAITPNPSAGALQVRLALARAGHARLTVIDVAGREVATLLDARREPGHYTIAWDAAKERLRAGVYFMRLVSPDRTMVRRVAIVP
jgi:hypothetical protein